METLEDHRVRIQDLERNVHRLEAVVIGVQADYHDLHKDYMALLLDHNKLAKDGEDRREKVRELLVKLSDRKEVPPEPSEASPVVEEEAGGPRRRWAWSWARHFWFQK